MDTTPISERIDRVRQDSGEFTPAATLVDLLLDVRNESDDAGMVAGIDRHLAGIGRRHLFTPDEVGGMLDDVERLLRGIGGNPGTAAPPRTRRSRQSWSAR